MGGIVLVLGFCLALVLVQIVVFAKWVARRAELQGRDRRAWLCAGLLIEPLENVAVE